MKENNGTVTRFAPSPTGYIHIGNVRSAIYPFLIAKKAGGRFILRIEDTDQARYVEGATDLIMETLKWLGLEWDEGPEVGGENGPYYQSERKEIYRKWAEKMILSGRAYVDETKTEEIERMRKEDNEEKLAFLFRNHRPDSYNWDTEKTLEVFRNEKVALRFKAEPKRREWTDEVMGKMHAGPEVQDDIILIKKDGMPTYNFAHIVDDAEMGVTHIARGVEYLASMPNYLAMYEALELTPPKFLSLPHILAPSGNKKLGKRDGAKSVNEYRKDGILPEAMLNYLACLGWNDGTEQEIYSMEELIEKFTIPRIQSSPARFDERKILWYNGQWIRKIFQERGVKALYEETRGFWSKEALAFSEEYRLRVLSIIYDRLKTFGEIAEFTDYFFREPEVDVVMMRENKFLKKFSKEEILGLLEKTELRLAEISEWTAENIQTGLNELLAETEKKPAELFSLIRIAISFAPFSPALNETMEVLGKERSLGRISRAKAAIEGAE
ncbi:MAG: glutamate--tRNA ligase [Candidatus Saccharibacteria bacterium]|nr:glutamate--tRNA ligase [Candidatus Saccharibacteria bacterium]